MRYARHAALGKDVEAVLSVALSNEGAAKCLENIPTLKKARQIMRAFVRHQSHRLSMARILVCAASRPEWADALYRTIRDLFAPGSPGWREFVEESVRLSVQAPQLFSSEEIAKVVDDPRARKYLVYRQTATVANLSR
ncbi:MAG: hypothetical protein NT108_01920 [Candidatus Kaiserbacteria bacterium]|nr:hypothetical protein [Candidatus Kaiserbacteria bacterium]